MIQHFTPLHYLPFIARSCQLMSKPALRAAGFQQFHFRIKSNHQDVARGFGEYVFLTLDASAKILCAKLAAGFPHVTINVPATHIEKSEFHLCRYNVAMTRRLKRQGSSGFAASNQNGRYYGKKQIPIAVDLSDKEGLLAAHYPKQMIEVLVPKLLQLPSDTVISAYSDEDVKIVMRILRKLGSRWEVEPANPPGEYLRSRIYADAVCAHLTKSLADPTWKGDGLEFYRI